MTQPHAGTWQIDTAHSTISFSVRHLGLSKVRGIFNDFSGSFRIGQSPSDSQASVAIDTASIDTGQAKRDEHLRSADFLDSGNYPQMTFQSTSISGTALEGMQITGDLTIKDTTKSVTMNAQFEGSAPDPMAQAPNAQRTAFSAMTTINRQDFGLTWSAPLETGQILVGDQITIQLEIVATDQAMESPAQVQDDARSDQANL